jgi:hypothetical protein
VVNLDVKPSYGGEPTLDLRLVLVGGATDFQPWMMSIVDEGGRDGEEISLPASTRTQKSRLMMH